jgi:hypothetical protein
MHVRCTNFLKYLPRSINNYFVFNRIRTVNASGFALLTLCHISVTATVKVKAKTLIVYAVYLKKETITLFPRPYDAIFALCRTLKCRLSPQPGVYFKIPPTYHRTRRR